MNVEAFLDELRRDPAYADQIVHTRTAPARPARYADAAEADDLTRRLMEAAGLDRLYSHQAEALDAVAAGRDVLLATGAASGKSFCYTLPILTRLARDPAATALLLFPTKALCQDQCRSFQRLLARFNPGRPLAGVFDGDTPASLRRRLRDHGSILFTNPDMLHAALMPHHARWARFLSRLQFIVLDEAHVYSGIFGANMMHVMSRLQRLCRHYGADPPLLVSTATVANPLELAEGLTRRRFHLVDRDGSPRGARTYVFWNPPRVRQSEWRSRASANVEACRIMTRLIMSGAPTITFSKARVTAEMIYRYVCDALRQAAPHLIAKVTPYRGGYLPELRREIEARLFDGSLIGVSTTSALELGIDVGSLEACLMVGYPGTRASFFQQAGRAGRTAADSVVFLVGLDTSVNQYIMSHPDYLLDRNVEEAVLDPDNPFVLTGHLRCAASELPLAEPELPGFGPHASAALRVLEENLKLKRIAGRWYHAAAEVPQTEIALRGFSDANVIIQDAETGAALGEVDRFDAPPLVHPQAVYLQRGETYLVESLDLDRNVALIRRTDVDYYTQPLGGTDVHHIDRQLREKDFGTGQIRWGEVTAYSRTYAYERIHFYSLDTISVHGLSIPAMSLDTMAFWIVPPESSMDQVRRAGLDAHSGLRGIGYATRMLLPLFMTCDTLDFSHTIGSVNSPWNAIFVFERYARGLGFTVKAYERMHEILPCVLDTIENCPCAEGCPCCVGKPLRGYSSWNVERGEASIPSKPAAVMILRHLLAGGAGLRGPDRLTVSDDPAAAEARLEQAIRRRLERMREPDTFHAIVPPPLVRMSGPAVEARAGLPAPDAASRARRRGDFARDLHKRIAHRIVTPELPPLARKPPVPPGMKTPGGNLPPTAFPGRPPVVHQAPATETPGGGEGTRRDGDLAARARKRVQRQGK